MELGQCSVLVPHPSGTKIQGVGDLALRGFNKRVV